MDIADLLVRTVLLLLLCGAGAFSLIYIYRVLRALHISVTWVTWIGGSLLIALSALVCLAVVAPALLPHFFDQQGKSLAGYVAFFIGVDAAGLWISRQWFLRIKRRPRPQLIQRSRTVLMFLRKHHLFFGWIVAAGAMAHTVFYLPILASISSFEEITGFLAIGILALMVLLGLWLWFVSTVRKKRMPVIIHTIHSALTIAFFVVLLLHI